MFGSDKTTAGQRGLQGISQSLTLRHTATFSMPNHAGKCASHKRLVQPQPQQQWT